MKVFISTLLLLILAGCGATSPSGLGDGGIADSRLDLEVAACERRFPDAFAKPATPRVQCFNQAKLNYQRAYDVNTRTIGVDLVQVMNSQMLVAAEAYDSGQMSQAEFAAAQSRAEAEFTTAALQRQNSTASAQAAQSQAAAAQSMAATARTKAIQDAFSPKNTTCTGAGNSVTCRPTY